MEKQHVRLHLPPVTADVIVLQPFRASFTELHPPSAFDMTLWLFRRHKMAMSLMDYFQTLYRWLWPASEAVVAMEPARPAPSASQADTAADGGVAAPSSSRDGIPSLNASSDAQESAILLPRGMTLPFRCYFWGNLRKAFLPGAGRSQSSHPSFSYMPVLRDYLLSPKCTF
jgi:hypothetical protein